MGTITWDQLTERQQHYLGAIFQQDQSQEKEEHNRFRYTYARSRPASEWRNIDPETLNEILGKLPKNEQVNVILRELEQQNLITCTWEKNRWQEECLKGLVMTKAGRALARAGLGVRPHMVGGLTENQEKYAQAIADAGLAPLPEVLAAFRDKKGLGQEHIKEWGYELRRRQKVEEEEAYRQYRESKTRYEPCAYPGCSNMIKVQLNTYHDYHPEPVRKIMLWDWMAGLHTEIDPKSGERTRVKNTFDQEVRLYACSKEHAEALQRVKVHVTLTIDEEQEQRLQQILYPVCVSQEARHKVSDLARFTAMDIIAQADPDVILPTRKNWRPIHKLAEERLALLIEQTTKEGKELADNLEEFKDLYQKMFLTGWREGIGIRDEILKGNWRYRDIERWQPLYAALDQHQSQDTHTSS